MKFILSGILSFIFFNIVENTPHYCSKKKWTEWEQKCQEEFAVDDQMILNDMYDDFLSLLLFEKTIAVFFYTLVWYQIKTIPFFIMTVLKFALAFWQYVLAQKDFQQISKEDFTKKGGFVGKFHRLFFAINTFYKYLYYPVAFVSLLLN